MLCRHLRKTDFMAIWHRHGSSEEEVVVVVEE